MFPAWILTRNLLLMEQYSNKLSHSSHSYSRHFRYVTSFYINVNIYFIYLFLERGREGEREEKHQCAVAS